MTTDLFLVQIDDLWVDVNSIIAIRATPTGDASILYCKEAASFRVRLTPAEVVQVLNDATAALAVSTLQRTPQYTSQYTPTNQPVLYANPSTYTNQPTFGHTLSGPS